MPACQGQWLPEMDFAEGFNVFQTIGPNYLGGLMESEARVAIHFTHRVGAIVTTIYILGLCSALLRIDAPSIKKVVFLVAGLLALQICLGISNILLMVPLVIAVAHNAVGAFLLLSLVLLATRLWMAQPESGTTPADEEVAA
ncbi:MAG: COX15/CtaA family protein [Porticoccaceae bacterium]